MPPESPRKSYDRSGYTREARSQCVKSYKLSKFRTEHMSQCKLNDQDKRKLAGKIQGALDWIAKQKKASHYNRIAEVLDKVNSAVHEHMSRTESLNVPILRFVDHHHATPLHHPVLTVEDRPHFLAVFDPTIKNILARRSKDSGDSEVFSDVPWHVAESVIEVKNSTDRRKGPSQCAAYLGALNQARPDKPGAYGVSLGPEDYEILWSDPSGVYYSDTYKWKDKDGYLPLAEYITSLYVPPKGHSTTDSSIHSYKDKGVLGKLPRPLWGFDGLRGQSFDTIFLGTAHSRMTRVYAPDGADRLPVVKESYRPPKRRFKEEVIITGIHKEGIVPGVVHLIKSEPALAMTIETNDISLTSEDQHAPDQLQKTRLVMDATGDKLDECESVLDFLKVMFDAVEVHRFLVLKRNVLHRDVSKNNVLCKPIFGEPPSVSVSDDKARPRFIKELLEYEKPAGKRDPSASCLLFDFDNAMELNKPDTPGIKLFSRTGTAIYIARALAQDGWCKDNDFQDFPQLESTALRAYIEIFGNNEYHEYKSINGLKFDSDRQWEKVSQEPRHDAESFYWIIVVFLLCSRPDGPPNKKDTTHEKFSQTWDTFFYQHKVPNLHDNRGGIMVGNPQKWEQCLHPGLISMAPFLAKLSTQLVPEYHLLVPIEQKGTNKRNSQKEAIPAEYLHEAMRRLLLEEIMRLAPSPLPLDTSNPRIPTKKSSDGAGNIDNTSTNKGPGSSSKRKAEEPAETAPGRGTKRERTVRPSTRVLRARHK